MFSLNSDSFSLLEFLFSPHSTTYKIAAFVVLALFIIYLKATSIKFTKIKKTAKVTDPIYSFIHLVSKANYFAAIGVFGLAASAVIF